MTETTAHEREGVRPVCRGLESPQTPGRFRKGVAASIVVAGVAVLSLASAGIAHSAPRVALVVGNGGYDPRNITRLDNPVNDARLMEATLKSVGFEVVLATDAGQDEMKGAIKAFGRRLREAGRDAVGLFYYAGHGVEAGGNNYLIPLGAEVESATDLQTDTVPAQWVLSRMEDAGNRLNLVILDACRNNPYAGRVRGGGRGLVRMDAPSGSLIAYSAAPGKEADDGEGENSPYTLALAGALVEPGLKVEDVFKRVRARVEEETGRKARKQTPWEHSSLKGDFYFVPPEVDDDDPGPGPGGGRPGVDEAKNAYETAEREHTIAAYQAVVAHFPGFYATLAQAKVKELEAAAEAERKRRAEAERKRKAEAERKRKAEEARRFAELVPAMVRIPGGCFQMGSPESEAGRDDDERRHEVCVEDFSIGKHEVTRKAFRRFVESTGHQTEAELNAGGVDGCYSRVEKDNEAKWEWTAGRSWRSPGFEQPEYEYGENYPVVCVSFNDAQKYLQWLSNKTGREFRLPTEAEWEYAARAGTETSRHWGDDLSDACAYANVADRTKGGSSGRSSFSSSHECTDGYFFPAPVGRYRENGFGLHDMMGNVWEWTCSEYDRDYGEAETVCATGSDGRRVLRGGSWSDTPWRVRSAYRYGYDPDSRDANLGFRLVQD